MSDLALRRWAGLSGLAFVALDLRCSPSTRFILARRNKSGRGTRVSPLA
jgi:hypothetical protein